MAIKAFQAFKWQSNSANAVLVSVASQSASRPIPERFLGDFCFASTFASRFWWENAFDSLLIAANNLADTAWTALVQLVAFGFDFDRVGTPVDVLAVGSTVDWDRFADGLARFHDQPRSVIARSLFQSWDQKPFLV